MHYGVKAYQINNKLPLTYRISLVLLIQLNRHFRILTETWGTSQALAEVVEAQEL